MLEDSLREAFHRQVESLPMVDDPATVAVRRGRRSRHLRLVAGGLAAVLVLAGLVGGSMLVRDWWQQPFATGGVVSPAFRLPEPLPDRPAGPDAGRWHGGELGVEVRVVNRVWTATGERLLLRGSALVDQAYRTPHGLVYGNDEEIRLHREDGAVVDLVAAPGPWVVSPDGQRVATVSGVTLQVFRLGPAGLLGEPARAGVPAGTEPVSFWGDRVIISGPAGDRFDVWDPAALYQPTWTSLAAVYGQVDGDLLVLVAGSGGPCLARIPAGAPRLEPAGGQCRGSLAAGDRSGWLSPTGEWLALPQGDRLQLVAAGGEQGELVQVATCPREERVEPVWWSDTVLLSGDHDGAVSCDVDGSVTRLDLPGGVGRLWQFLPSLGTGR
jgi:hypothetical protein